LYRVASPVAPTTRNVTRSPSPVSLSPKRLSKLGCSLKGQTADKVLATDVNVVTHDNSRRAN